MNATDNDPDALCSLAVAAADRGDMAAAEQLLRRAQALRASPTVALQLAIAVFNQKRHAEAAQLFEAVFPQITITPPLADAYAQSLEGSGRLAQAIAIREQILTQAPSAAHAVNFVSALERDGAVGRLEQVLPSLLQRFPDHAELLNRAAMHALCSGDYPRGFALLRRRLQVLGDVPADPRLASCPVWDGQPFAGTLLISMEPHLGEEILVSSLLSPLAQMRQAAVVEVDARLVPLFARSWPELEFVARGTHGLVSRWQQGGALRRVEAIDLAQHFRRGFTLPGAPAWLRPPETLCAKKRAEYQARWPGKRLVGISWRSMRLLHGIDSKSIPLASLPRTLGIPDIRFVDLQYGDFHAEVDRLTGSGLDAPWRDPEIDPFRDIDALAAQLCALDAFVTVSNTTAHLAGALGVPTTVLLPKRYPVLWHWGYAGERSTWYESVRLLRNPQEQAWAALDAELAATLSSGA